MTTLEAVFIALILRPVCVSPETPLIEILTWLKLMNICHGPVYQ
jgi:hypothetical protein